jgi:hypothetical protein
MRNGVNLNALTSQDVADMGDGPVFFSTLAQIEKVSGASDTVHSDPAPASAPMR